MTDKRNTFGGWVATNPSGGLLSKGRPLGVTGPAWGAELIWQLRGRAGARQAYCVAVAHQRNRGLRGACLVSRYRKVD